VTDELRAVFSIWRRRDGRYALQCASGCSFATVKDLAAAERMRVDHLAWHKGHTGEKLVCEWCGDEFERPSPKGQTPKFCRPAHRQRAHEQRVAARRVQHVVDLLDELTSPDRIWLDGCGECIWCRARAAVEESKIINQPGE
jgi:hypothetical protein